MKTKIAIIAVVTILMAFTLPSFAIEKLTLSLQSSNVVLTWPSVAGETYIIQSRASLDTNDTWQTLTNFYPAFTGTNRTIFVHTNAACVPTGSFGGGGGGGFPSFNSASFSLESVGDESFPPMPPMPPMPWDTSTWANYSANLSSASFSIDGVEPDGAGDGGSGSGSCYAFYRVVRNDLHIFGLTNGAILRGTVTLPVEIGFPDHLILTGISIQNGTNLDAIEGLNIDDTTLVGWPQATWDTLQTSNGIYHLNVEAQFSDGAIVQASSEVIVTVSNLIWFPNSWNVCGYFINVEAQTVYTNGTYKAELFDGAPVATNKILEITNVVDSAGYITYGGTPGFVVYNYDQATGEQYSSPYYTVVVTVTPADGFVSASGSSANSAKATNTIIAELPWDYFTKFSIGFMPLFGNAAGGSTGALLLQGTISQIYTWADLRPRESNGTPWGNNQGVMWGTAQIPFELNTQYAFSHDWVARDMRDLICRNLYFYGHGGPDVLGTTRTNPAPTGYIRQPEVENALHNHDKNPFYGFNNHPYRFVFLDGCNTANGDWCKTFGIPKKRNMPLADFQNRGLRTRAFLGWSSKIPWSIGGTAPDQGHIRFISGASNFKGFFENWLTVTNNITGATYGIEDAARKAAAGYFMSNAITVYGYPDLKWYDTVP